MTSDDAAAWQRLTRRGPPRSKGLPDPLDVVRRVGEALYGPDWPRRMASEFTLPQDLPLPRGRLREWHRQDLLRMVDQKRDQLDRIRRVIVRQQRWPD